MRMHEGWKLGRVADVARVISGYAFKSKDFQDEGGGIPVIKIRNIRIGYVDLSDVQYLDEKFLSLDEKYHVRGRDLLISLTGSHLTQPSSVVGRVAIHSPSHGVCLLNQRAGKIIVTRPDECDSRFLFYTLRSEDKARAIALMAHGAASQANVSPSQVESVEIVLPPIQTQRKISGVLSAYDDLIENNLRRIKILESMAQALYREWFVRFRFPGHQKAQFVASPTGPMPRGWKVESILEVPHFRLVRENVRPYDGKKRYFATADVNGIEFVGEGIEYPYDDKPSRAQKQPVLNSVWFARMKETYKVLPFTRTNERLANSCILSSGFAGFEAISTGWFGFLFFTINSPEFHEQKDLYCTGATQMSLTNEGLRRIRVLVPDNEIALRYSRLAEPTVDHILTLQAKNAILRRTRDLLLPKLISGEVDVSELDIYIGEEGA